jgi:hypothetical protein
MLRQLRGILFRVKSERMMSAIPVQWTRITKVTPTMVHISHNTCQVLDYYVGEQNSGREIATTN